MPTTTFLKIKKKKEIVWINSSLLGKEGSFPCMNDEHCSSFPDYCLQGWVQRETIHSRKAVPGFWLQLFELLETNHQEGLILWHQLQCRWKKGELWHVCSLKSGSMLWIPTWWLQGGKNILWVCLLSEIHAVNPAAESDFHNAKETYKAKTSIKNIVYKTGITGWYH